MTRLPHENQNVVGLEGPEYPKYRVGPLCSAPGCSRLVDHPHHIWRRSFVIGDKPWVKLWDGQIIGNLTGLCWRHHDDVTEGRVDIEWVDWYYVWVTHFKTEENLRLLLDPQPPKWGIPEEVAKAAVARGDAHWHEAPGGAERCPTCHRVTPKEREKGEKKEAKRNREKWAVTVPKDERENGADVLDTLLVECAKIFGHDETKALRYFTLALALSLVVQHGHLMMGDE